LRIERIIWIGKFVEKIYSKHGVIVDEVEEILLSKPLFRRAQKGRVEGEDLFFAYGKTYAGRHLFIVFVLKEGNVGIVISARDMTRRERRYYDAHKKKA